ncbi:hypothetical protein DFJ73DRAFT_860336 [Zopfochytrium polystomum]|nr:hypothetical protein DFJ73DRAFT_860336 [Zopfochytrium polystomum]
MGGTCSRAGRDPPSKPSPPRGFSISSITSFHTASRFTSSDVLTLPALATAYDLAPPFRGRIEGKGSSSVTTTVRRKADRKLLVLKRVQKSELPPHLWYVKPCTCGKVGCAGAKCPELRAERTLPLELVLMRARGSGDGLPELVEVFEDETSYYYITKTHGLRRRKLRSLKSWFRPAFFPCSWSEYMRN